MDMRTVVLTDCRSFFRHNKYKESIKKTATRKKTVADKKGE